MRKRLASAARSLAGLVFRNSPMDQMTKARSLLMSGSTNATRIPVNEDTAMRLAAFFASVRIIAETKASLPLKVYERKAGGGRAEVTQHPACDLLHLLEPNPDQTPMVWKEVRQMHLLVFGNSYTEVVFDGRGNPIELIPIHPTQVTPMRDPATRERVYKVESVEGTRVLDRSQMIHVAGLGDGLEGWSPVRLHAQTIGIGLGQDRFLATFHANAAKPSLIVEYPGKLSDDGYARLKNDVENQYSQNDTWKPMLLEGGMKATVLTMPLNEAQFLEGRKFQGEEIASRIFRLPPHVAGYLDRATFNNIAQMDQHFEKHTMRPWLIRDEEELDRKLFSRNERRRLYVKHNVDALLRADLTTRYQAHKEAILSGWKSVNEVRASEDLNPIGKQGDVYVLPMNMTPAGQLGQPKDQRDALSEMTAQTVRGLLQRERTHCERSAKNSNTFLEKWEAFSMRQRDLILEKLAPVLSPEKRQELGELIDAHTAEISELASRAADLAAELPGILEPWAERFETFCRQLVTEGQDDDQSETVAA